MTQTQPQVAADRVIATAKIEFPLTQDFVNNILITAFEGGINYWANSADLTRGTRPNDSQAPDYYSPEGFCWEFADAEDGVWFKDKIEDFPKYRPLTIDSFREGFEQYMRERGNPYGEHSDAGNYDAPEADIVVQYAVFGEIVFG